MLNLKIATFITTEEIFTGEIISFTSQNFKIKSFEVKTIQGIMNFQPLVDNFPVGVDNQPIIFSKKL